MAWSVIREATDDDKAALNTAAVRFCKRHGIKIESESSAISEIESLVSVRGASLGYEIENKARKLRPLWARIVRRALGSQSAEGISNGHVGFSVK